MSGHHDITPPDPLTAIAGSVRELVEPARHAERFERFDEKTRRHLPSKLHWTRHPSLLDQLRAAETAGRGGDGGALGGFESRPAARLEAIDRLMAIDQAVDDWLVRRLGADTRDSVEDNLRALVGAASRLEERDRFRLQRETERWVAWARVVTGWDSAPWRPNAACPMCETNGSLRVRLDERLAACLHCGETWDSGTLGLLADHLRGLNAVAAGARQVVAKLEKDLTTYFARCGPCLCCSTPGVPARDARHRDIDRVVGRVLEDEADPESVADDYGLPVEAVFAALAWATHPESSAHVRSARASA